MTSVNPARGAALLRLQGQTVRKGGTQSQGAKAGLPPPSQPGCQDFNLKNERKIEKMAKVRKRILSLVMSLVMVFTLLPVSAFAADECDERGTNNAGEVIPIKGWKDYARSGEQLLENRENLEFII